MSLPSLEAALATGSPVTVCARPWAEDLLAAYPLAGFIPMTGRWRRDRAAVHAARRAAGHRQARGLLLPDSLSSALVFRFAGLPCAGYRDDGRSPLLRWPCRKPHEPMHAVQSWFHLTRFALSAWRLPLPEATPPTELSWRANPVHESLAQHAMAQAELTPGQFVLIAPTATGLHHGRIKVWDGFDTLTRSLQTAGYKVVMAPPPAERVAAQRTAPTAQLLEPLTLGAFAQLAHHAAVVVCNDSGVSHLAAAACASQITLFGVTEASRTGPWSNQALRLGNMNRWPSGPEVLAATLTQLHTIHPA
ncbi:MAG TPA: glycosyltransferase family 9 protein [Castellaniella sp.]|uniref:glycosyltransferase family 9 protein n=1 Tax=Castellaniella sp. TaxID=1955812 RepID=UPI002F220367